jgi:hypothetical protein
VLQSLVGVMLAYQLLSGSELIASRPMNIVIVGGLAAMVLCLWYVPTLILQAAWFSGTLIGIDTILVTATIYLSGNARSDLYLSYFVLMLIAASVRRLSHVIGLSLLLCFFVAGTSVGSAGFVGDGDVLRACAANDRSRTKTKNSTVGEHRSAERD